MSVVKILEVLSPGILTSVQDMGRYGYGRYGVAPSGALDFFSLRIGNLLVGNAEDDAGLETTLMGLRIKALTDIVIAVTGGNLQPQRGKQSLKMWRSHVLSRGDILAFKGPLNGFRSYITVSGGIYSSPLMGSRSTNLPSGFGGIEGRGLKQGDVLFSELLPEHLQHTERQFKPEWIPNYRNSWILRAVWGPQDDHFTSEARDMFLASTFKMSPDSDRSGIRLQGPVIPCKPDVGESIISEGVISGAIQIPGDGQPIIILGETVTGGYRKIAAVISADLQLLGQIRPGDDVRFRAVPLKQAHDAFRNMEEKIRGFKENLLRRR
ncbi:MAG: biotin-dependent carboxyltransferase family protein [Desulfobacterales bacterium]|jgi:antagonist of KipI